MRIIQFRSLPLLLLLCVPPLVRAEDYLFYSSGNTGLVAEIVGNTLVPRNNVEGVTFTVSVGSDGAIEYNFPANLIFDPGDSVNLGSDKPMRINVTGNIEIPAGMTMEVPVGFGGGGAGGSGADTAGNGGGAGSGGFFGAGGLGGLGGIGPLPPANGGPGFAGTSGTPGESGTNGIGKPGLPGHANPNSGGAKGSDGAAGRNGFQGVASAVTPGGVVSDVLFSLDGGNGSTPLTVGIDGGDGVSGLPGGHGQGGSYTNSSGALVGGGGGGSGAGGGGGGGGGGGAGGAGGSGGAGGWWVFLVVDFVNGGHGGPGGRGGAGANGSFGGAGRDGADGGAGGGAFELNATGSIIVGGILRARGGDGGDADRSPNPGQDDEVVAGPGLPGIPGEEVLLAGNGGRGGDGQHGGSAGLGGTGGGGGHGGGGAGGTIKLTAGSQIIELGSAQVDVGGGLAGGLGATNGAAGRVVRSAPSVSADTTVRSGTVEVTQLNGGSSISSVDLALSSITTPGVSILETLSNSGDYSLEVAPGDDVAQGVLITSVAENGRDHSAVGGPAGVQYATTGIAVVADTQYYIPVHQAPSGAEMNINTAFAWFSYERWLGAVTSPTNHSPSLTPGEDYSNLPSASSYFVDFTPQGASSSHGILLASSVVNGNDYAISQANDNGTFTVYNHDNGTDGNIFVPNPVAFVYIDSARVGTDGLVAMGRVNSDGTTDVAGGSFMLTKAGTGRWYLTIPGHNPSTGTLITTPARSLTPGYAGDNMVSYGWDATNARWIIESRDLTGVNLQDGGNGGDDMFNFAFFVPTIEVKNLNDSGPGSLRNAISEATPGAMITFDPALNGSTISLSSGVTD